MSSNLLVESRIYSLLYVASPLSDGQIGKNWHEFHLAKESIAKLNRYIREAKDIAKRQFVSKVLDSSMVGLCKNPSMLQISKFLRVN